jgi:hypothetical protein
MQVFKLDELKTWNRVILNREILSILSFILGENKK